MVDNFTNKEELLQFLILNQNKRGKDVANSTLRTYHHDIWDYLLYCEEYENDQIVAYGNLDYSLEEGYIKSLSIIYSYYTITKKVFAVSFFLRLTEQENIFKSPHIKALLSNIKRTKNIHQKQAPAFSMSQFKKAVDQFNRDTPRGIRNTAIFHVLLETGLRKSDFLSLRIRDVIHHEKGLKLSLGVSKNNQYGEPAYSGVFHRINTPYDPASWLLKLIKLLPDNPNQPLFCRYHKDKFTNTPLSPNALTNIIKKSLGEEYSCHSFRAAHITMLREKNIPLHWILKQTHHKNYKMLDRYTRHGDIMENNGAQYLDF